MSKQIVLTASINNVDDFRKDLLDSYVNDKNKIIQAYDKVKILNYKLVFDGKYIIPDNCIIMSNTEFYGNQDAIGFALSNSGYTIDGPSTATKLIDNKITLMIYLKKCGYNTPEMFVNSVSDYIHNFKFDYSGQITQIEQIQTEKASYGTFPWESDIIKGYAMYFYMNKLASASKIAFKTKEKVNFKTIGSEVKYGRLTYMTNAYGAPPLVEDTSKEEKAILDNIKDIDKDIKDKIMELPLRLNNSSCEVYIGIKKDNTPVILNVISTHKPLNLLMVGKDVFMRRVKKIFDDVVG